MENFKLKSNILFTVDQQRIVLVNKERCTSMIIEYPEAAIWSVMIENHHPAKATLMLMPVLHKSESETKELIDQCGKKWKESGIME
jgi:hypothetical protein